VTLEEEEHRLSAAVVAGLGKQCARLDAHDGHGWNEPVTGVRYICPGAFTVSRSDEKTTEPSERGAVIVGLDAAAPGLSEMQAGVIGGSSGPSRSVLRGRDSETGQHHEGEMERLSAEVAYAGSRTLGEARRRLGIPSLCYSDPVGLQESNALELRDEDGEVVAVAVEVTGCARCHGEGHWLMFYPLTFPVELDDGGPSLTHWATCPATGEPVLMGIEPE
jgi:hypothetical protein